MNVFPKVNYVTKNVYAIAAATKMAAKWPSTRLSKWPTTAILAVLKGFQPLFPSKSVLVKNLNAAKTIASVLGQAKNVLNNASVWIVKMESYPTTTTTSIQEWR